MTDHAKSTSGYGSECILITVAELNRLRQIGLALRDLAKAVLEDVSNGGVISVDTDNQARVAIEETLS